MEELICILKGFSNKQLGVLSHASKLERRKGSIEIAEIFKVSAESIRTHWCRCKAKFDTLDPKPELSVIEELSKTILEEREKQKARLPEIIVDTPTIEVRSPTKLVINIQLTLNIAEK